MILFSSVFMLTVVHFITILIIITITHLTSPHLHQTIILKQYYILSNNIVDD